jgi:hypothetical protein
MPRLMKNPAFRMLEGAGGFSLPNKAPQFNVALASGLFFIAQISLGQQSECPGLFRRTAARFIPGRYPPPPLCHCEIVKLYFCETVKLWEQIAR